jgi:hypothetical protein
LKIYQDGHPFPSEDVMTALYPFNEAKVQQHSSQVIESNVRIGRSAKNLIEDLVNRRH